MNVVFSQHQGAMPLYLVRDLHYRESFYGGLFVLNTLIIVAIEVPLNLRMAHWPARPALTLATVLIAVGFGALGVAQAPLPIADHGRAVDVRRDDLLPDGDRLRRASGAGRPDRASTWARSPAPSRWR